MADPKKQFSALSSAVYQQDLDAVAKLVTKVNADLQPYNAHGDSLLMSAINNGAKLPLIKLLVEQAGAKYDYAAPRGTPIKCAQERDRRDVIEYFASRGANVKYIPFAELPQEEKDARLATAITDWTSDDLEKRVTAMLKDGANPNTAQIQSAKREPPKFEIRKVTTPVTHFLASQGADKPKVFTALIEAGADLTAFDEDGLTPLHVLADGASAIKIAKLLLTKVPIDVRDRDGRTPLHHAAASAYWDAPKFVDALLDAGADLSARDNAGKRPVDVATGESKKLLLKKMSQPISTETTALLTAIGKNDLAAVTRALAAGANPSEVDSSGKSWGPNKNEEGVGALHIIFVRDVERAIADLVLAHRKLDINVRNVEGWTPLRYALQCGRGRDRAELVERLLALGADTNIADDFGRTPIFQLRSFYEYSGELELYDRLIAAGADARHADRGGETMLDAMWESVQRFSEVNDKKGFVRVMTRLVADKIPSKFTKYIEEWLATKGAKYAENKAANAKATKTKPKADKNTPRATFEKITAKKLAKRVGKKSYLPLGGDKQAVALFDWFVFLDEADDDQHEYVDQIREYHITGDAEAHVEAERWIPFGIVGMTGSFDSYEETGVAGTLYVDLSAAKGDDAPVIFATQEYLGLTPQNPLEVGKTSYATLMKKLTSK